MSDNRVCIVLDPEFGSRLQGVDKFAPIWIVQSAANDPVVAEFWKTKTGNITSFRAQEFEGLMDTVDRHHPGWRILEIHGLSLESAVAILSAFGGGAFSSLVDGFLFERSS